jgi:hypothetical protein
MGAIRNDVVLLAVGAIALAALAWYAKKKITDAGGIGNAAAAVVTATIDNGAQAVAYGVGDAIGIPRTNAEKCAAAQAAGDLWTASFQCKAASFLGGFWDTAAANTTTPAQSSDPVSNNDSGINFNYF